MIETPKRRGADPAGAPHLTREDLLDLRASLELERERLAVLYTGDAREERAIEFVEAEDDVDRTGKGIARAELSARADAERERLELVEEALARLADGSYGLCLATGRPIPRERLRAVPWARYAREVQERVERGELEEGVDVAEVDR